MKTKSMFAASVLCLALFGSPIFAQSGTKSDDVLPPPTEALQCSTILRYLDDAILRANDRHARLLIIVRSKDLRNPRLIEARTKSLKTYFRFRRITKDVDVLVEVGSVRSNVIDLFIGSEKLYSLPIRRRETMKWSKC